MVFSVVALVMVVRLVMVFRVPGGQGSQVD